MTERAGRHAGGRGRSGSPRLPWLPRPRLSGAPADSAAQTGPPEQAEPGEVRWDQGGEPRGGFAADSSGPSLVLGNPVVRGRRPAAGGPPGHSGGNVLDGYGPAAAGWPPTARDDARLRPLPAPGPDARPIPPAGPAARRRPALGSRVGGSRPESRPVGGPRPESRPVGGPSPESRPVGGPRPEPGPAAQTSRAAVGSASRLRLVWVYPDLLSTYGDRGNLLVLERRARLRGIDVEAIEVNADQAVPVQGDIYLLGGGEDLPQILAANRLRSDGGLAMAAQQGRVVFAVCAGYQMMGHEFGGVEGEAVTGLGLLDITSGRGEQRGVGELVADVDPELGVPRLTGFENHQGTTTIGPAARPLARVSQGVGNGDGTEGAFAGRVLGTYLHGPALARNPGLADLLLTWAVGPLTPIDPAAEEWAARLRAERMASTAQ